MCNMKRTLALLIAAMLVLAMFAGCGNSAASAAEAGSEATEASSAGAAAAEAEETEEAAAPAEAEAPAASAAEPAEASAAEAEAEAAEDENLVTNGLWTYHYTEISLPLTEEDLTLTLWTDFLPPLYSVMSGMEENSVYIELTERTGVQLDISSIAMSEASTQASLVLASGDFPDIWLGFVNYYSGTIDSAVDDDIIYDLADYKEYMPNYFSLIDENEELVKLTYSDTGVMSQTYGVFANPKSTQGLACRKDWLEALDLEVPETYDEFHDVLTAFKENYDATYWMNADGEQYFSMGYDVSYGFEVVDGVVEYGPVQEGFRDYLTMMNQWYEEGLIWHDFATSEEAIDEGKAGLGEYGMYDCALSKYTNIVGNATDENFSLQGLVPAVQEEGQTLHLGNLNSYTGIKGFSLTTAIDEETLPIACQWLDYWYTPDGSMLANYGVEGEAYNLVDGEVVYTDLMLNNPDLNFTWAMNKYAMGSGSFIMDGDRIYNDYNDEQWELMDVFNSDFTDHAYTMPSVTMTVEESDIYTATYNDIETYVEEHILTFINGDESLDNFDSFVQAIYDMGIEDCIAQEQSAYDRYMAR